MSLREEIIAFIRAEYGAEIEPLRMRQPAGGIFRHPDNRKGFALIMNVPRARLGLGGEGTAEVLDVKTGDLLLRDFLLRREGFFPGLHTVKGGWVAVLLDGTVPADEIRGLIASSFRATASAGTRNAIRPPKEWIIPSNPVYYDSVHAFDDRDEIDWTQGRGIREGDTIYLYVGAPVSAILFRCRVTRTGIPYDFRREGLTITALMRIRLEKRYDPARFTFEMLKREYGIFAVRGPRGVPHRLSEALKQDGGADPR